MSRLTFTQILRNRELFNEAVRRNNELGRAHSARVYAKPTLDHGDDDYDFVNESLERWGDRNSPRDPNWRR